ncbi:MAG: 50S ribosomal protein L6 [Bacteroidales bacterium]|jgi:large subunit ribosomal protein L6
MSRIAKSLISINNSVNIEFIANTLKVSGSKGFLTYHLHSSLDLEITENHIKVLWSENDKNATAQAGTARANISNLIQGVSVGFEKKMSLVGVGYRAQAKDNVLSLSLGLSHPLDFVVPEGITIETPTQTDIIIKGSDKQKVGQVAANIRSFRPPEPYKGKGIRYSDEQIIRKEAKKK